MVFLLRCVAKSRGIADTGQKNQKWRVGSAETLVLHHELKECWWWADGVNSKIKINDLWPVKVKKSHSHPTAVMCLLWMNANCNLLFPRNWSTCACHFERKQQLWWVEAGDLSVDPSTRTEYGWCWQLILFLSLFYISRWLVDWLTAMSFSKPSND